jgi:formylglycine-generating enzyme required for sulfatase activity
MDIRELKFEEINYTFPMIFVRGTNNEYFLFGPENEHFRVRVKDFYISRYPVTQILWKHIMGSNPAHFTADHHPVENVSYDDIASENGFLERINAKVFKGNMSGQFRLPTETEWEYAARGGIHWQDYFIFSGSDNIDEVGWYKHNSGNESKTVGQKKPNQLGLYDMCGNLWEWCSDYFQSNTNSIPRDGSPCTEESADRVLRGGCYHNWGIHCTVMKRYAIGAIYKDPCIGFRLVLPA